MALPTLTYAVTTTGIQIPTQAQLLAYYQAVFLQVYGVDVTQQASTSPDNQFINILIQSALDVGDLIVQVFNGFDPDSAFGNVLDLRCAINGIQRQAATYSTVNISLTITGSTPLYGLDQSVQPVYTVADSSGNQWQLVSTKLSATTGTAYVFQAANPGAVLAAENTITIPVTIVLAVTAINNPTVQSSIGINEESDSALKIRRQISVSLPSQGYLAGLLAALLNISGVNYAAVYENTTSTEDAMDIPGHSIWVIVAGGNAASIANAIYTKRNAGCGMKGSQSYNITQLDGSTFIVYWDDVVEEPLYIAFTVSSLNGTTPPNISAINGATGLSQTYLPGVNAEVNINQLATLVQALDPNTLVTSPGFSSGAVQTITFSAVAASGSFKLSYGGSNTVSIAWNASASTIQSDLRSISGLGSVTVSGSISSQSLVVTMTGVTNPTLLGVNSNTLETSGSAAITLAFTSTYTNTLSPTSANYQFEVLASNIIILPMMLTTPGVAYTINGSGAVTGTTFTIAPSTSATFTGQGGYGTYTYACTSGTGGSINSTSGVYTSGTAGTDTLTVTDSMGNTTSCTVTVT